MTISVEVEVCDVIHELLTEDLITELKGRKATGSVDMDFFAMGKASDYWKRGDINEALYHLEIATGMTGISTILEKKR